MGGGGTTNVQRQLRHTRARPRKGRPRAREAPRTASRVTVCDLQLDTAFSMALSKAVAVALKGRVIKPAVLPTMAKEKLPPVKPVTLTRCTSYTYADVSRMICRSLIVAYSCCRGVRTAQQQAYKNADGNDKAKGGTCAAQARETAACTCGRRVVHNHSHAREARAAVIHVVHSQEHALSLGERIVARELARLLVRVGHGGPVLHSRGEGCVGSNAVGRHVQLAPVV